MNIKVQITRQENADYFKVNINDIVEVDFEEYVAAVVASEIGNSPLEACKAQAVAARTYAIKKGVLNGKTISDSSETAQAYRAKRYNKTIYPNCIQAVNETIGQVLYYDNKPIDAVYSSSNGGKIVSAKEKWGTEVPYLIANDDKWTAATGYSKNGHGVGMSQWGCIYAAEHGFLYTSILTFDYPLTKLKYNYGKDTINTLFDLYKVQKIIKEIQDKIKERL